MILIRNACEADANEISKIGRACHLGNWSEIDYREEIKKIDSVILLALSDNIIIGFIAARFSSFNPNHNILKDNGQYSEADIINFGVIERYRNKGAGSKLLNEFIKQAVKMRVKSIWLEVREQNGVAIDFYEKNGFVKMQVRNNFYLNPSDNALIMKLDLAKAEQTTPLL